MTTLPQTTPMRLPRPSGAGQIAIPNAPGPLMTPAGGGGIQMTGADVWRVFRANWWLILGMVVLMAIVGFFANGFLAKNYPKFTAGGLIRVQLREEQFARGNAEEVAATPQAIELQLKTQARALEQPSLMIEALQSEKIRQTEWFNEYGTPEKQKENLLRNFSVQPIQDTRLIAINMTYRVPAEARIIAEEIVNRYILQQQAAARTEWEESAQKLEEQLREYDRENRKINDALADKARNTNSENLLQLYSMLEGKKYERARLTDTRATAQRELAAAKNEFEAMDALIRGGDTPPEVEALIMESLALNNYQRELDEVDQELGAAAGANTTRSQGLARRRQSVEQKMNDLQERLRSANIASMLSTLKTKRDAAQEAMDSADARIKIVDSDISKMEGAARTFKLLEEEQKNVKDKMDEVNDELQRIQNRKLPSGWSPVVWNSSVPTPDKPSFPKLWITMPLAIMFGLALSVGIAFLREITDTTVRSPRDIARVGQMNLLGMIPHEQDDPQASEARLPLVIFDAPHSMAAEEFRKLRTRLQHTASLDSTRSILVSSANPGDGKTTVACNLAAGLALNGRRILLVDANFRRADIHNIFEIANEQGFSDVLNDMGAFDTAVRDTPVQNLYVMPTGPKPVNATELLESQLLIDFIERALEDYDHVIFDSGPLLIVSETMALAPRVDGVVTVVRARTNTRGVLQRMRDALRQVKSEHLGVVLNAVRSTGGGYYGRNIKTYYAYQNS